MAFFFILNINKDVIQIYNNKDIELLYQDLIGISLDYNRCISQSKRYYLVLEMTIAGFESCFSFIPFLNPHLMIDIHKSKLGKTLS